MFYYLHAVHLLHYTSITHRIHGLLSPRFTSPALHVNHTQNTWPSTSTLYISRITRQSHTEYMAFFLHAVHLPHYTSITHRIHGLLPPRCTSPALHVNHTHNTWPSTSTLYISRITRLSHTEYMAFYLHAVTFGGLGATYTVYLRLIGKLVGDFLLVIIELFSLGAFVLSPRCTYHTLHGNHSHNTWSSTCTLYICRITRQSQAETWSSTSTLYISRIIHSRNRQFQTIPSERYDINGHDGWRCVITHVHSRERHPRRYLATVAVQWTALQFDTLSTSVDQLTTLPARWSRPCRSSSISSRSMEQL